ncbi:TPA: methionine adenosyltransferase [Methanosarcina acetivorans]|uniref:Methionine adenosyltransferase n=2 Tax=Methanosarcina acetivorans TaxID=2214 RepID=Q8TS43_METAC|nr:methionine adenosyltransferase [Methanosarcina acetivorans]AAM04395.1 methionine adenosyltransferase [Methanosarcina acetivorans C2A]HIH95152.1 methionine adenosyltransferase [Methanosarcina acetivorans]
MRNIVVEELKASEVYRQKVEVVERKGLGHPDYICDAIMEQISVNLSQKYLETFGTILHHNIDKGMLVAGQVEGKFRGGRVVSPMRLIIGDRATFEYEGVELDIPGLAVETAKNWLSENLRFVDPESVIYQVELKRGSAELTDIFSRGGNILGANDTSAAVGYAPLSPTERLVLETERYLNSKEFKKECPESGEDIKVMGLRHKEDVHLTVATPLVDRFVESEEDYFKKKIELHDRIEEFAAGFAEKERAEFEACMCVKPTASLNTLDIPGRGMEGIYTTVTGTSAEDADCGEVGRGNRVNGIIPLNRPVSSEAAAGKNPVSHIGKIYNLLSHRIAAEIYNQVPDVSEVYVWLLSEIGTPIDQPQIATAQLIMRKGAAGEVEKEAAEVIEKELENIHSFSMELVAGKRPIC